MKLALALIVALQVSVCLCDLPKPSEELLNKYKEYSGTFYKRVVNAYEHAHEALVKLAEGTITGEKIKELAQHAKENQRLQGFLKFSGAVLKELHPVAEKAGLSVLGVYGEYLRPYIGIYLDTAITNIKPVLDVWLPAEKH